MGTDNKSNHGQDDNGADGQGYNRHKPYKRENWIQETPLRQGFTRRDIRHYSTEEGCEKLFVSVRWPNGVECFRCHSTDVHRIESQRKFNCRSCQYRFSVTAGTWLHKTRVPLAVWLETVFDMVEDAHGVSANEISRKERRQYRTVWSLCHDIRLAMKEDLKKAEKLSGIVEVDETWVGGKVEGWGRGFKKNKILILGIRERGGGVFFEVASDRSRKTLHGFIERHVDPSRLKAIYTDDWAAYDGIGEKLNVTHRTVNHRRKEYARGRIHTNSIESIWASWSRRWRGTHHHISRKYAALYAAEASWMLVHARSRTKVMDLLRVILSTPDSVKEADGVKREDGVKEAAD